MSSSNNLLKTRAIYSIYKSGPRLRIFYCIFCQIALLPTGYYKGYMVVEDKLTFQEIMLKIRPYLMVVAITGTVIFAGVLMIFVPALKLIMDYIRKPKYN